MMTRKNICNFIAERLLERLNDRRLIVVYDPTAKHLLREVAQSAGDVTTVRLDAGLDPLGAREGADKSVREGMSRNLTILYVPHAAPETNEEKVRDPWSGCAVMGGRFPARVAESYEALCEACYPGRVEEIRMLFRDAGGEPDFETVDLIGNGAGEWPLLRGASGAESRKEILGWLLGPRAADEAFAKAAKDIRAFAREALGLELNGLTDLEAIRRALWDRALLTDFIAGFGDRPPAALATVGIAPEESRALVADVMRTLRASSETDELYRRRADDAQARLSLESATQGVKGRPGRETFRFEERRHLKAALECVTAQDAAGAEALLSDAGSVWAAEDGPTLEWGVVRKGVEYLKAARESAAALRKHSNTLAGLVDAYARESCSADLAVRALEQAIEEFNDQIAGDDSVLESVEALRRTLLTHYRTEGAWVQRRIAELISAEGWPVVGELDNAEVFDKLVAPKLGVSGNAVAFIIVDGLRYELGKVLAESLSGLRPELMHACARMPTVTAVGKATLLPGGRDLELVVDDERREMTPVLGGRTLAKLADRMNLLRAVYGERFQEMTTADFLSGRKRLNEETALLVLRNDDIDKFLENNQEGLLRSVQGTIMNLARTVEKVRKAAKVRFTDIVIATDHGFVLNYRPDESDVCPKPDGRWLNVHDRMLLGDLGTAQPANVTVPAASLGIRANVATAAFPAGQCAYSASRYYFHGGASLQEAVVPVIRISLAAPAAAEAAEPLAGGAVELRPKKERSASLINRVYARDPAGGCDAAGNPVQRQLKIVISVHGDRMRKPVGKILGSNTDTVTLLGDEEHEIRIRLDEFDEASRRISVRALNPASLVTVGETSFIVELTQ